MSGDRELDVIVYGATGFVGRLTADYLASHAPEDVRIGLGGRSQQRLETVRASLGDRAAGWPLVVADSSDHAAVAALAQRTTVVATTVGPYRKYGGPLAGACAAAGTHYADLTGEVLFVRETMGAYHDRAVASGARIVHACGFDSIPSDLGVLALHESAQADGAGDLEDTTFAVMGLRGAPSGGTIDTIRTQIDEIRSSKEQRRIVLDAYALSPDRSKEPGGDRDFMGIERDDELGVWVAPFVMGPFNTRIVRRSNALLDWAYGRRFRYREVMSVGTGPIAPVKGAAVAGAIGSLAAGLSFKPTRIALDRVLPSPGDGPGEESRRKGYFKIDIHTRTAGGRRVRGRLAAPGGRGDAAPPVMPGESALSLARAADRLPARAGVLTPATAMGDALAGRLRAAGQTLEV